MMPSVIPVLWLVILHALPIAPADKGTHCVIPCGTKHPIGMHFSDTARLVVTIVGVGVGELKIQDAKETRARGRSSALQSLAPVIANPSTFSNSLLQRCNPLTQASTQLQPI